MNAEPTQAYNLHGDVEEEAAGAGEGEYMDCEPTVAYNITGKTLYNFCCKFKLCSAWGTLDC